MINVNDNDKRYVRRLETERGLKLCHESTMDNI